MVSGITGRVDSRCSIKGFYLQSGIIGKTVIAVMLLDVTGFLKSVVLEGVTGLRDILCTAYLLKGEDRKAVTKNLAYLLQLMGVVCGKYQLHTL